jgi:vancomycin permeability regulator SanA
VLADRVAAAARLYHQGKVQRLLLSGSQRPPDYDEPAAMLNLALKLGVPRQAISTDPYGDRTFNTCLNARRAFGIHRATLVTQAFHLPRSLAICQALGMQVTGVQADGSPYSLRTQRFWELRETLASLVALWDAVRARWLGMG